jgi:hypothetical protein
MIFIGPGSPLVKISGLLRLFSSVLGSVSVSYCQSRSGTVLPVPVFELTGVAGLLHLPRQAVPVVRRTAAKEATPVIVAGPRRQQRNTCCAPRFSPIFHFREPFFTVCTVIITDHFKHLQHVCLSPPVLQGLEAQLS